MCCLEAVRTNLLSGAGEDGIGVHFSSQQLRDRDDCGTLLDVKEQEKWLVPGER